MALLNINKKRPLGIYIHVPFCRSKCEYCDFYSLAGNQSKVMAAYLDAVTRHIAETGPLAPGHRVDTIYFGGGTPTHFGAGGMISILNAIRKHFDVATNAEITFEANPDSVTPLLLRRLKMEGFNRVSLGIQCDDDEILQAIGRPHTYAEAVKAVERIRRAGFRNLSLDLIYGLPGQTLEAWVNTLHNVLRLKPDHISCYGLKVEEGTPLYAYQDQANLPDDDLQADMYLAAVEILRSKDYRQYEISNFARREKASRHNLKYWNNGEYLGFGPDASSDFGGKRFSIVRDLDAYVEGIRTGGMVLREVQEIPQRERAGEYLMLRLRTSAGINWQEYEKRYLLSFKPLAKVMDRCCLRNWAMHNGKGGYHLTPEGYLMSNTIIGDLLDAQQESESLGKIL